MPAGPTRSRTIARSGRLSVDQDTPIEAPEPADTADAQAPVESFADLGVMPSLVSALTARGITVPFPVQHMAIPVAMTGTDMIGQARTGTGKTLAFGLPLLQRIVSPAEVDYADLAAPGKPQSLVICPTRELALQVATDLEAASADRPMRVQVIYGGRAYEPQLEALHAGVDVVVGTPGRLLDLARQRQLDLGHVKVVVLDEADEMLDLGFLADVETLLGMTPELRQTMLFSATMPSDVITLARRYMRHPVNVRAESPDENATVPTTAQFVYRAHRMDKEEILSRILQAENRGLVMMFARTKRQTQSIADELKARGFSVAAVHGDINQQGREKALASFRAGKVTVLLATDVAARGIDVEGVTHVVNVSCPEDEKTYLHRIGRTGRAGASGVAVTLVDWEDMARWSAINTALGLPYPDPPETYSTSEHLFHDLGIPPGTTGMMPGVTRTPVEPRPDSGGRRGGSGGGRSSGSRGSRSGSSGGRGRDRGRASGQPGAGSSSSGSGPAETAAASSGEPGQESPASTPRKRRRRRTRGGSSAGSSSSSSAAPGGSGTDD
ncbi:MAG: DEAD/DEAH box helicase [Jiangellales bacterium]